MGHEYTKIIVNDYMRALDEIGLWMGYSFEQMSYSRWAAKEVLRRINKFPNMPPLFIISEFYDEMERCSKLNQYTKDIFIIASDVANEIINWLVEN